ncbi:MAG: DUF3795 domain-containing protein [Oscillospiraceae bacterium]
MQMSRCGLDCESCPRREEYGCDGCTEITDGYWGSKCEIKQCCENKRLEHCGLCREFPCEVLREFCYDEEFGDDGERLLNCKRRADEARVKRERRIKNLLLGAAGGIVCGVILGEIFGAVLPYAAAGTAAGVGIAVMVEANKRK